MNFKTVNDTKPKKIWTLYSPRITRPADAFLIRRIHKVRVRRQLNLYDTDLENICFSNIYFRISSPAITSRVLKYYEYHQKNSADFHYGDSSRCK